MPVKSQMIHVFIEDFDSVSIPFWHNLATEEPRIGICGSYVV